MRYVDKNFGGSSVFDFKIWWRHVKRLYWTVNNWIAKRVLETSKPTN